MEQYIDEEYQEYEQDEYSTIYPKVSLMDENGNPLRDARYYPFVSRAISSVNRVIASSFKYRHFEEEE